MSLFAPPSGAYNQATVEIAETLGMKTVLWSKDTIDWRDKDSALVYTRATKNVKGGDFVLMHPTPHTAEALPNVLQYYERCNLRAITVSENLQQGE
jgi:peptidoglycan/xylan/chitin deacetylase (PgdA/CDA1 family)